MNAQSHPVTAAQLIRMSSPGKRYELVRGELQIMEPTGGRHGQISVKMTLLLSEQIREGCAGTVFPADTGFRLERDPDTVLAPDVAFVSAARLPVTSIPDTYIELAPDIAVEVISPSDSRPAVDEKARTWVGFGTQIVWVVDPKMQTVTVHQAARETRVLTTADQLTADPVLPGFACPVRVVFEP